MAVKVVIFGGNTTTKCLEDRIFSGLLNYKLLRDPQTEVDTIVNVNL